MLIKQIKKIDHQAVHQHSNDQRNKILNQYKCDDRKIKMEYGHQSKDALNT